MVLQNYQNVTEMTSNMIYIVVFGIGLKCPRKKDTILRISKTGFQISDFRVFGGDFFQLLLFLVWFKYKKK